MSLKVGLIVKGHWYSIYGSGTLFLSNFNATDDVWEATLMKESLQIN